MSRNKKRLRLRAGRAGVVIGIFCAGGVACGRSTVLYEGDAFGNGVPTRGGTGGAGGTGARGGSAGQSGRATGGTGGSVNTGGSSTTGGTTTGVGGSSAGSSSVSGAGGATQGPYACSAVKATCNAFHEFPDSNDVSWGSGAFTGGIAVFGPSITRTPETDKLHITGTVSSYAGVQFWFSRCSDVSQATGVQVTLSGNAGPNRPITFQPLTNSDYPWQPRPQDGKGACTAKDPSNPWTECFAPDVEFQVTNSPLFIAWNTIGGGAPVPWNAMSSPGEIVGLQWLFWWDPAAEPYDIDVTIDDVLLVTGSADVECVTRIGGTGGMSGAGGSAGSGATAGAAGTITTGGFGGASQGGSGNEGGVAGEAGAGGDTGTSSAGAPDAGFGGI